MRNRIAIIGPFPNPTTGCSYANEVFALWLEKNNLPHETIDTNSKIISSSQGDKFSIKKTLAFGKKYLQIIKIWQVDVVYITPGLTFYGLLKYAPFIVFCSLFKKKYVLHIHGNNFSGAYNNLGYFKKWLFSKLVSGAIYGIVLSESLKGNLLPFMEAQKVKVVKNFVGDDVLLINDNKKTDKLRVIYLSNLIVEKGFLDLIAALEILQESNIEFEAVLAGKVDDNHKNDLEAALKPFEGRVKYIGFISGAAKNRYLSESNVFILPTYYDIEGQPISILEAMGTGNIIITTKQGGIPDIVDENNGYFVDARSPMQIASILTKINKNLPDEIHKFSGVNRKKISDVFTEEAFCRNLFEILTN